MMYAVEFDYDERPFNMEMAEQHLTQALAAAIHGQPKLAAHYTRLAGYRLRLVVEELDIEECSTCGALYGEMGHAPEPCDPI